MKSSSVYVLLFFIFISGCGSSTQSRPIEIMIPLSSGNTWIYKTVYYNQSNTIDTLLTTYDTSFVGLSTGLNGSSWFFYNRLVSSSVTDVLLVQNTSSGFWIFDEQFEFGRLFFNYPTSVGSKYIVFEDSSSRTRQTQYMSTISTNEMVTTEKGNFSCYHYQLTLGQSTFIFEPIDFYIAPTIGIVKLVNPNPSMINDSLFSQGYTMVRLLTDYHLQ